MGSAEVMGIADKVGSLEVGKFADFVVISPRPRAWLIARTIIHGRTLAAEPTTSGVINWIGRLCQRVEVSRFDPKNVASTSPFTFYPAIKNDSAALLFGPDSSRKRSVSVAWDFAFDIPGKPENAYGGRGAPRRAVRCLSSRFVFHHCLSDFQYATDLANLGQVAFANCHTFHRNTHSSLSLNSSAWNLEPFRATS
jgi:hypothetical protein